MELASIRNYIEKFAYITSIVLEMDILICDTASHIVGDSERYGDPCIEMEKLRTESVIAKAMRQRETIVFGNAKEESEGCINCPNKAGCHTETIIAYPIIRDGVLYGGIGVYSDVRRHKERLLKFQKVMLEYLDAVGDLIITKLEDEKSSVETKAENLRMNSIIETLDFALLSFDEKYNILYSNGMMKEILSDEENEKEIKEYVRTNGVKFRKRHESTLYLKKSGKLIEYEMTYVPIIIEGNSKGAEIYLKETSGILTKANQLIQPIKSGFFDDIIGESEQITRVKKDAMAFANSRSNVLIQGESGTGKEVFATAIHNGGNRADGPFVTVNCAAIPDNLIESELFGYVSGAFTGASKEGRAGKFEIANGGTLFLDEIGELPIYLQPKLLRALQEKKIQRVGSNRSIDIDIRVIAATNRNLVEMMENGSFREDLYYRLCVIPIKIPPLRERKEDIPLLAEYFLERYKVMLDKPFIQQMDKKVYAILDEYPWMGNVRELQNTIEYAVNRCVNDSIDIYALPERILRSQGKTVEKPRLLSEIEKEAIINALKYYEGTSDAKGMAAAEMGISRATLYRKIKEYEI